MFVTLAHCRLLKVVRILERVDREAAVGDGADEDKLGSSSQRNPTRAISYLEHRLAALTEVS